jgi:hypothetical protein
MGSWSCCWPIDAYVAYRDPPDACLAALARAGHGSHGQVVVNFEHIHFAMQRCGIRKPNGILATVFNQGDPMAVDRMTNRIWLMLAVLGAVLGVIGWYRYMGG